MEEYKTSNRERYATTDEHHKFATQPSKLAGIEMFRRQCRRIASSGERILDIGGGAGIWTDLLRSEGIETETVGVDLSSSILKERSESDLCVLGDIEFLPFQDESFDRAFFFASLHHVKHTQQAVNEAVRVIRKGGHLVLNEPISSRLLLQGKDMDVVDETQFCFSILYLLRVLAQTGVEIKYVYYQGFFRRFLPLKQQLTLLRICDRLDEILNAIPGLRKLGMFGSKLTLVAQRKK